jgi:hypothetical protein
MGTATQTTRLYYVFPLDLVRRAYRQRRWISLHQRRWQLFGSMGGGPRGAMTPIDYFMAIFAGMCIGVAGVAYIWS